MADGWGKRTKDREYIAFRNWLYNKYWWIRAVSPSDYKSSSYYPKWVALGRPGYVEAEEAETYEDKLTRYKEAVQSGQALSVRDYPDLDVILEPYEGAGWHWEQSSRDESGFPLLEPVWRRMPDEVTKPPITPGAPQIRSIGGYDYEYTITGYDEKGNPVYGWNLIGRTPEEGVSEKEQWEWQKRQAGLTSEAEAAELKRRTLAGLEGPEDWISRWMYMNYPYQQQQKEPLTVLDYTRMIEQIQSRIDWREGFMAKPTGEEVLDLARNLGVATEVGEVNGRPAKPGERGATRACISPTLVREELEKALAEGDTMRAEGLNFLLNASTREGDLSTEELYATLEKLKARKANLLKGWGWEELSAKRKAELMPVLYKARMPGESKAEVYARLFPRPEPEVVSKPLTPPAPGWLPQFAPWEVRGQPIFGGEPKPTRGEWEIPTPSGQQLARTPWSVRQGLAGYVGFGGARPMRDIYEHMAMMQPTTPRGVGYQRWQPMKQYA